MNFQQLRTVREAIRKGFNLTDAADVLCTSQSGVSRQIRELEEELGVQIFERYGKRLTGLTRPGRDIAPIIERLLVEQENIKEAANDHFGLITGRLDVAATHAIARYLLPPIVAAFNTRYPQVTLALHQASPLQVAQMVRDGVVDIGFVNEHTYADSPSDLVLFRAFGWSHCLILPAGHPLLSDPHLTLEKIAAYPIVTYDESMTGRDQINQAFYAQGLTPNVVLSAVDSDIIKAYVEAGVGIGIIAEIAYDPSRDRGLVSITHVERSPLTEPNTAFLAVRRGVFMRGYAISLINGILSGSSAEEIRAAIAMDWTNEK